MVKLGVEVSPTEFSYKSGGIAVMPVIAFVIALAAWHYKKVEKAFLGLRDYESLRARLDYMNPAHNRWPSRARNFIGATL